MMNDATKSHIVETTKCFRESELCDALTRQYGPLVKHIIGRLSFRLPSVVEHQDLVSYGTIGLMEALDRFDESRGVKFETYAANRIRGSIIDAMRSLDRMSRTARQKARQHESLRTGLSLELGRDPSEQELADAMGLSLDNFHRMLVDTSWVTVSLDGLLDGDVSEGGVSWLEILGDASQEDVGQSIEKQELVKALSAALQTLPERELLVVSLYYKDEVSMREIASILEISESRVSQLHARALHRLRRLLLEEFAA